MADEPAPPVATLVAVVGESSQGSASLVAVDSGTGATNPLVEQAQLGGPRTAFTGLDLSPDGATVTFGFGSGDEPVARPGLHQVDLAAPGELRRLPLDGRPVTTVGRVRYSPDGRWVAADVDGSVVVVDAASGELVSRRPSEGGYPVEELVWDPAGAQLLVIPYQGRGSCCTAVVSVEVDPVTGQMGEGAPVEVIGRPWFDAEGGMRTTAMGGPQVTPITTDASFRWVLGLGLNEAGDDWRLVWWESDDDPPEPRPLPTAPTAPWLVAW